MTSREAPDAVPAEAARPGVLPPLPRTPVEVPPEAGWQFGTTAPPQGAQVPPWGAPGGLAGWQRPVRPRERTGLMVFWFGLLGAVLLFFGDSFLEASWTQYQIVDIVVTVAFTAVMGLSGWLLRRPSVTGAAVVPAVVLLVLAAFPLLLPDVSMGVLEWWAPNAPLLETVTFVLLFAAWLLVRRPPAAAWAFLVPVAAVEYVWVRYAVIPLFRAAPAWAAVHLEWPALLAGGMALVALAGLLAGLLTGRGSQHTGAVGAPPAGWRAQNAAVPAGYGPGRHSYAQPGAAAPAGWAAPQSAPAAYGQPIPPGPRGPGPTAARTNGFAIASLVLGIIGGSVLAIIFGHVALSQIRSRGEGGRGLAIAGLVLGYLWLAIVLIAIIAAAAATSSSAGY